MDIGLLYVDVEIGVEVYHFPTHNLPKVPFLGALTLYKIVSPSHTMSLSHSLTQEGIIFFYVSFTFTFCILNVVIL